MSLATKIWPLFLFIFLIFSSANAADNCTEASGQALIEQEQYELAIDEFSCVIVKAPTVIGGYRGRIEAKLLLDRFSDAVLDYQLVTALVIPADGTASTTVFDHYKTRLASQPNDLKALRGASFARWWYFDYAQAIHLTKRLLDLRPNDLYPNLFLGSSRLLGHKEKAKGVENIAKALMIDPANPHARFIVADAYTYGGLPDPQRAFDEASLALAMGLNTPRIHAILAASLNSFGDLGAAAAHVATSIDMVTAELVPGSPLSVGSTQILALVPGRTFAIPISAVAGQTISITTGSKEIWDTIAVLLAPDGTPVIGADDNIGYFAAFDLVAPATGVYTLRVTSFESVSTGAIKVTRK